MKIPHKCPVCNGHQTVSKPPWVAGDQETWSDTSTAPYECKTCHGMGVLWEETIETEEQSQAKENISILTGEK